MQEASYIKGNYSPRSAISSLRTDRTFRRYSLPFPCDRLGQRTEIPIYTYGNTDRPPRP